MNRSLAWERASSRSCSVAVPASMRVWTAVRSLLGDFVFELGDFARGLHLGNRSLQPQRFFRYLVAGGFGLFGCLQGVGIGGLGAGTLRGVEDRKSDTDSDGRVVLLEAAGHAQNFDGAWGAGFRRDVVVLKVIEPRQQAYCAAKSMLGQSDLCSPWARRYCARACSTAAWTAGLKRRLLLRRLHLLMRRRRSVGEQGGGRGKSSRVGLNVRGGESGKFGKMFAEHIGGALGFGDAQADACGGQTSPDRRRFRCRCLL